MIRPALLALLLACPGLAAAQPPMPHQGSHHGHAQQGAAATTAPPTQVGQSAFAAIAEIVERLENDPSTDWSLVDIEALRQHLIDMDNVTLRARVSTEPTPQGARFRATSDDAAVSASIRSMLLAHAATMDGSDGWSMQAEPIDGGAMLTVAGANPGRIRALGLMGALVSGMHHRAHHLAIATGKHPHGH